MIPNARIVAGLLVLGVTAKIAWARTAEVLADEASPIARPVLPHVALYPAAGNARADGVADLPAQAEGATSSAERARLLLSAANEILSGRLSPACTAAFLRIEGVVVPDAMNPGTLLTQADALLDDVETAIREYAPAAPSDDAHAADATSSATPPNKPETAPSLPDLRRQLDCLRAFAGALRVYIASADQAGNGEAARDAASGLSPFLEDRDVRIAAAAMFWQAALRSRSDDPSRVRALLPLAMERFPRESLPYAFYARLLRCRLTASGKGYAAALALLRQMEERCATWFRDEDGRAAARRTIALMQIQVLGDWFDDLGDSSDASARQWCIDRITAIERDRFPDANQTIYQLDPAVPPFTGRDEAP